MTKAIKKPPRGGLGNRTTTYHRYREVMWANLDRTDFVFRSSRFESNGVVRSLLPDECLLEPKPNLFFKDRWHCGSPAKARKVAGRLCEFPDVTYLQLKGCWVELQWEHTGKKHLLPGQIADDREKLHG